ncbi:heterokaryon incompatibility protein-domain-containing protein [Xylogone sp. PMI_703]|nr:heterokaryon incompatibility protein-domain-containing protein [Xylogone sp. PMI_703]
MQGPSMLCTRCAGIFLDPNNLRSLIEKNPEALHRIEHYTISELKGHAQLGCALCSDLYHGRWQPHNDNPDPSLSERYWQGLNMNNRSFFEICPPHASGLRSEIEWGTVDDEDDQSLRNLRSFYYFTTPDSPISELIPSRPVRISVTNEDALRRIEQAFTECITQHESCSRSKIGLLPSRVIDIEMMCLYETEKGETGTYAALSYCWGGDQEVKTTRANISSKKRGIATETLPQTLQDAVHVCMQLRIRYLWIDALCIMQGDEDDVAREISQMANIYNRATVVIAASRAKTVHDGFLADIGDYFSRPIMLPARCSATCEGYLGIIPVPTERSEDEPLNQRGWACQEISLARRALIYTEGGVIWQCNALFDRLAFDGIQIGSHPSEDLAVVAKELREGVFQEMLWDQLVKTYTLRSLTDPDDRLPALAGIAAIAAPMWNSRYYGGLWEHNMEGQLGWRLDKGAIRAGLTDYTWSSLEAPSWSWASVYGPVWNVASFNRSETPRGVKIISCQVTPAHPENPLGRVTAGRLTVEAFLVHARYADPSWLDDTCIDSDGTSATDEDLSKMWCLLLGCAAHNGMGPNDYPQWHGLLVSRLSDGSFKRLGHFSQDLDYENWLDEDEDFEEIYAELEARNAVGLDARFPTEGRRRRVVLV